MNVNTAESLYSASLNFLVLDQTTKQAAMERFDALQKAGVILGECSFDDEVWHTTDQYSRIGLHFSFSREGYDRYYKPHFGITFEDFVDRVKSYITTLFYRNVLPSLENVILDLRHIIENDPAEIGKKSTYTLTHPTLCQDFFSLLPDPETPDGFLDGIMDALDMCEELKIASQRGRSNARSLAAFDTYAAFNDIMAEYWKSDIPDDERLFYFPLYLWWNLTGCIPLRPREFLLTTRDCLSTDAGGKHYITLRRNGLKGHREGKLTYRLDSDYFTTTFRIPDSLYEEISAYMKATEKFEGTDIDTLFVTDPHYRKWQHRKPSDSRFLTYVNMTTILRYFYSEIICGRFGYTVVSDNETRHLGDKEIQMIHLGDARHIALINLMKEGGTPVTAMFLAGHTNEEMAAHYYSNLETMIECQTYRQYRKYIGGGRKYQIAVQEMLPAAAEHTPLESGGTCYSEKYAAGSIDDCVKACGDNGEIGYCPSCSFYRPPSMSYFEADNIYKHRLEDDCKALVDAVNNVRHEKGAAEDIGEALLKVQESSVSFQNYLMQKKMHDGKKEA